MDKLPSAANDNQPQRYGPWPTTAEEARRLGTKAYKTGKPCKRGHFSERWTTSNNCVECGYQLIRERKKKDQEYLTRMREYHKKYNAERKKNDPEFLERCRENGRKNDRRPERRARQNSRRKERIATDPEFRARVNMQAAPARKRWKKNNPEARQIHSRTRRARLAGVGGTHTVGEVKAIHARQKFKCAECGVSTKKKKHVDHIIPIALGGSNAAYNLQILCPTCNDRKGAKHPIEFAKLQGRLL